MRRSYQVIKTPLRFLLLVCISVAIASCSGDDGDTGPQGPQGEQGAKGDKGDTGAAGADAITKNGYFEGTVTGTRQDGTAFTETFKYEYGAETTSFDDDGDLWTYRYRDPQENSPYLYIQGNATDIGTANEALTIYDFDFEFTKELSATSLFYLEAWHYNENNSSTVEVTNYSHDSTTGVLSFDFTFTGVDSNDNTTGKALTITGSFNSGTRVYEEVVSRKAN